MVLGGWLFATREKAQKDNTTPTEEVSLVSVPNFAGQSYTRISTDEVQNQRFKITAKYEYNNKVNVGYIISQSIEEGQQVPYGTELVLTVSKGTEYIDIPDVSGKDYADAEKTLTDAGFTVKKVEKSNDGTHQAGKVIASTPSSRHIGRERQRSVSSGLGCGSDNNLGVNYKILKRIRYRYSENK